MVLDPTMEEEEQNEEEDAATEVDVAVRAVAAAVLVTDDGIEDDFIVWLPESAVDEVVVVVEILADPSATAANWDGRAALLVVVVWLTGLITLDKDEINGVAPVHFAVACSTFSAISFPQFLVTTPKKERSDFQPKNLYKLANKKKQYYITVYYIGLCKPVLSNRKEDHII